MKKVNRKHIRKSARTLLSIVLALAMLLSLGGVAASAAAISEKKASEPMILVGGLSSYSPDSKLGNLVGHYMGGIAAHDYAEKMRGRGITAYESTQSPFGSNWDRACELYANIKGGRVDYGKAHSEKYGHERYGRTFPGLYPQWDNDHPVDLFGYSMGAPTTRILASLLAWGNKDEQAASPNDCSDLFKGGNAKMINSVSTISGTNNGTTLADGIFNLIDDLTGDHEKTLDIASTLLGVIGLAAQGTDISSLIDPMFDQYGLQPKAGETNLEYVTRCINESNIWKSRDVCWWDMSTWGSKTINETYPDNPNAYYFAYACSASQPDNGGPQQKAGPNKFLLTPLIDILGHYKCNTAWGWDDSCYENDGMVNTQFAFAPFNSKRTDYKEGIVPERGAWVNMPKVQQVEHSGVAGFYLVINKTVDILDLFSNQARYVQALA